MATIPSHHVLYLSPAHPSLISREMDIYTHAVEVGTLKKLLPCTSWDCEQASSNWMHGAR